MVEIFRRSVWAFFRVELEALENYEEYRTINIRAPRLSGRMNSDTSLNESETETKYLSPPSKTELRTLQKLYESAPLRQSKIKRRGSYETSTRIDNSSDTSSKKISHGL